MLARTGLVDVIFATLYWAFSWLLVAAQIAGESTSWIIHVHAMMRRLDDSGGQIQIRFHILSIFGRRLKWGSQILSLKITVNNKSVNIN